MSQRLSKEEGMVEKGLIILIVIAVGLFLITYFWFNYLDPVKQKENEFCRELGFERSENMGTTDFSVTCSKWVNNQSISPSGRVFDHSGREYVTCYWDTKECRS